MTKHAPVTFNGQIFSVDSAKAIKAQSFGYLNGICYMAPSKMSGKNVCSHASRACIALCLGWFSGQSSFVADLEHGMNPVRLSRVTKTQAFMTNRAAFLARLVVATAKLVRKARRMGLFACVRLNGSSDIAYEGIRIALDEVTARKVSKILGHTIPAGNYPNVMAIFPDVQFVDYTKNPQRFERDLPRNYHLTFSRSEANESAALELLSRGVNVAVVFEQVPSVWNGFTVVDGDKHDLRHLDPRGSRGTVIGLLPKGNKAKRDITSGFVVRLAA